MKPAISRGSLGAEAAVFQNLAEYLIDKLLPRFVGGDDCKGELAGDRRGMVRHGVVEISGGGVGGAGVVRRVVNGDHVDDQAATRFGHPPGIQHVGKTQAIGTAEEEAGALLPATTRRMAETLTLPDGSVRKNSRFEFVQFRRYPA